METARAAFVRINQLRAHEYVAEQLRRHLALGLVPPGESLPPERELAAMFGVGRPTVQRALRLLEADRLVDTRRGRRGGSFVTAPTEDVVMEEVIARVGRDLDELAEVIAYREAVEPVVARIAAEARADSDLVVMREAVAGMEAASSEAEYMRNDTAFHLAIAAATRNRFLAQAIEEVRVRLSDATALLPESDVWHRRIDVEHEAVLGAIEVGDEEEAEHAMAVHVRTAEQGLRAVLAAVRRREMPRIPSRSS
jgi:GntR family transcriptional regulator, transcriptional repressor for pyruvate dehydrogenase complex